MGKFKVGDRIHVHAKGDTGKFIRVDGTVSQLFSEDGLFVTGDDGAVYGVVASEAELISRGEPQSEVTLEEVSASLDVLLDNTNANFTAMDAFVNALRADVNTLIENQRERDQYREHKESEGEDYESRIEDLEIICGQTICASHVDHGRLVTIEEKLDIEHVEPDHADAEENGYNMYHRIRDALRENLDGEDRAAFSGPRF